VDGGGVVPVFEAVNVADFGVVFEEIVEFEAGDVLERGLNGAAENGFACARGACDADEVGFHRGVVHNEGSDDVILSQPQDDVGSVFDILYIYEKEKG